MRSKTPDPRTITLEIALLEHLQFLKKYLKKIFFLILIFYCSRSDTYVQSSRSDTYVINHRSDFNIHDNNGQGSVHLDDIPNRDIVV
jgi:hypothetical protein